MTPWNAGTFSVTAVSCQSLPSRPPVASAAALAGGSAEAGLSGPVEAPDAAGENVSVASFFVVSVSWLLAIAKLATLPRAWTYTLSRDWSPQYAIVIGPGVIVMFDPLVVYVPDSWLQSALAEKLPSLLNSIV